MKKFSAILLAAIMALSLAACKGNQVSKEIKGQVEPAFESGSTTSGTYKSDFLGITCTFDETWTIASNEELAQLAGLMSEQLDNQAVTSALESGNTVYDLYASGDEGRLSANIVFQKLNAVSGLIDAKSYIEYTKDQVAQALEQSGFTDVVCTPGTRDFVGQTADSLVINASINGVTFYEEMICLKKGDYLAAVTVSSLVDNELDTLFAMFTAIEK